MIELLQVATLPPYLMERLANEYTIHDFTNPADPDAMIDEVGPRVRGVLAGGMKGPNANLIHRLENLEIIAHCSVGFDASDVVAAQAQGVVVTHTPDVLTGDVADHYLRVETPSTIKFIAQARSSSGSDRNSKLGRLNSPPPSARTRGRAIFTLAPWKASSLVVVPQRWPRRSDPWAWRGPHTASASAASISSSASIPASRQKRFTLMRRSW